ncbi:uncharacterized protein [Linepithema humile]|uniref:uncharacterized protein isoform X1 n=2 Tax=Linepithema humile TaxID=83485 RepID=UPI00351F7712
MQMHPRALHVLALALTAAVRAGCDDKTKWYSGLRSMLKNCPLESQNSIGQDDSLEAFRNCVQQRAIDTLDTLLNENVIPVFNGVDLIRVRPKDENDTKSKDEDDASWSAMVWNRLTHVLRTHAFKVNVDHIFNATPNASESDPNNNVVQARKRRRRKYHVMPYMMMGLLLMGTILIPMGFQFLAVLGGKALILAKMALILSSIQGLKKIATSGINYGLYHAPVISEHHGWHDRSQQVFPEQEEQNYPAYVPPHP